MSRIIKLWKPPTRPQVFLVSEWGGAASAHFCNQHPGAGFDLLPLAFCFHILSSWIYTCILWSWTEHLYLSDRYQHRPLGDARRLLQNPVQLQTLAVQQPPEGNVSQLTYDPERLIQVQEHGELPLPLPGVDQDGLRHQTGGDPLQPRHLCPGNDKLNWGRKKRITYFSFLRWTAADHRD